MLELSSHLISPGESSYECLQGGGAPRELLPGHLGENMENSGFRVKLESFNSRFLSKTETIEKV